MTPLSKEEQDRRRPLPADVLIDAHQEPIHIDKGRLISATPLRMGWLELGPKGLRLLSDEETEGDEEI